MLKYLLIMLFVCQTAWAGVALDNTDDYIDSNYNPNYGASDSFTICSRASLDDAAAAEEYIVGSIPGVNVAIIQLGFANFCGAGLKPVVYIRDDTNTIDNVCSAGADVTAGTPFSLCLVYDDTAADVILYQNGSNVASDTSFTALGAKNLSAGDYFIGARNNVGGSTIDSYFDGVIYEVAFWRTALNSTQVAEYHNQKIVGAPCNIVPASLEKYFKMDDGVAETSADTDALVNICGSDTDSGSGNDGSNNTGLTWKAQSILNYPQL